MSEEITLTLPSELYLRVQTLAQDTGQQVADVLVDTIDRALPRTVTRSTDREDDRNGAISAEADEREEFQWNWSRRRAQIYEAIRKFSEETHANY